MRAELLKVRSLPTPMWCLIVVTGFFILGLVASFVWGLGPDRDVTELAIDFPLTIVSIVFGVWIVGVEFGQKTLRQVLTADPRRGRLILSKLATFALLITAAVVFFHLIAAPLYSLAAGTHDQSLSMEYLARTGADNLMTCLIYGMLGGSFALITASMAGGMTLTLVFIFVLDGIISIIPKVGDYNFGQSMIDLDQWIIGTTDTVFGDGGTGHSVPVAAVTVAAWLALFLLLGYARFRNSDVK